MTTQSIKVSELRSDTAARRPLTTAVPAGVLYFATDTLVLSLSVVNSLGVIAWVTVSSGSATGWDKYVVWGGAAPGPSVLYSTITAALAAAVADGAGVAKPVDILVMPGAYTENLTLQPGIHVKAFGAAGGEIQTPTVTITGQHTVADVAGTLSLAGLRLVSTTGVPLTMGGANAIVLQLARCALDTTGGTDRNLLVSNSNAASRVALDNCQLVAGVAATDVANLGCALQAKNSSIQAGGTNLTALALSPTAADVITRCDIQGTIVSDGGSVTLRRCRVSCSVAPALVGAGPWNVTDIEAPSGLTVQSAATVNARKVVRQHFRAVFNGAGPHTMAASGDTVVVQPGANVEATLNLPDVTTLIEGDEIVIGVGGNTLGSSVVVVMPNGAQAFSDGALFQRIYEGGSIVLRVDRAGALWRLVSITRGTPQAPKVQLNSTLGNDDNPGTVALPVATLARALTLLGQAPWTGSPRGALVNVAAGHAEDLAASAATTINVPYAGTSTGAPLEVRGVWTNTLPAVTPTGRAAANIAIPTWEKVQFAANGAYAANAATNMWALVTGGALDAKRMLIATSTNVLVELTGCSTSTAGATSVQPQLQNNAFTATQQADLSGGPSLMNGLSWQCAGRQTNSAWWVNCFVTYAVGPGVAFFGYEDAGASIPPSGFPSAPSDVGLGGSALNGVFVGGDAGSIGATVSGDSPAAAIAGCSNLTVVRGVGSRARFARCSQAGGTVIDFAYGSSLVASLISLGIGSSNWTIEHGSALFFTTGVIQTASGNALLVSETSNAQITGLTGTSAAGGTVGLRVAQMSRAQVTDPNVGTTISGAASAVVVGANAGTTWALIAAGGAANVSDLAAAVPQICRCST